MIWQVVFLIVWFVVVPLAYHVGYRRGVEVTAWRERDRHTR